MRRLSFVNTTLALAIACLPGATGLDAQAQSNPTYAYINSEAILQATPAVREAQQTLGAEMQQYRSEAQEMAQELEQMIQEYERQQLTLSPEAKENREAEIRQKQQAYQARLQELDQLAQQRQNEVVQPVMDRIHQVIEEIRVEGSYQMVFDVSTGAIIAADPELDLTDEVLRRLQQQEAGDTSGAADGGTR